MFHLYDIVSRLGEDRQIIVHITDGQDLIDLVCIYPGGCFRLGDTEFNIPRRYDFIRCGFKSEIPIIEDVEFNDCEIIYL